MVLIFLLVAIILTIRWAYKRSNSVKQFKQELFNITVRIEQGLIRLRIFAIKVLRICFLLFIGVIAISATYYWSLSPSEREKYPIFKRTEPSITEEATTSNDDETDTDSFLEADASNVDETDTDPLQDTTANDSTVNNTKLTRKEKKAKKREERKEKKAKKREEKIQNQHDKIVEKK